MFQPDVKLYGSFHFWCHWWDLTRKGNTASWVESEYSTKLITLLLMIATLRIVKTKLTTAWSHKKVMCAVSLRSSRSIRKGASQASSEIKQEFSSKGWLPGRSCIGVGEGVAGGRAPTFLKKLKMPRLRECHLVDVPPLSRSLLLACSPCCIPTESYNVFDLPPKNQHELQCITVYESPWQH